MPRLALAAAALLPLLGCATGVGPADGGGGEDLAASPGPDLYAPGLDGPAAPDFAAPRSCRPDDGKDGQPCGNGCPVGAGTVPVVDGQGVCRCQYACPPGQPGACPCGRNCASLVNVMGDAAVPNGLAACIPATGPGERCGSDPGGKPHGRGPCLTGTTCVREDQDGVYSYCMYRCIKPEECPAGTTCVGLMGGGSACVIQSTPGSPDPGQPCKGGFCAVAAACDGQLCRRQCNGPGAIGCPPGTNCQSLVDPQNGKISAWVCK